MGSSSHYAQGFIHPRWCILPAKTTVAIIQGNKSIWNILGLPDLQTANLQTPSRTGPSMISFIFLSIISSLNLCFVLWFLRGTAPDESVAVAVYCPPVLSSNYMWIHRCIQRQRNDQFAALTDFFWVKQPI